MPYSAPTSAYRSTLACLSGPWLRWANSKYKEYSFVRPPCHEPEIGRGTVAVMVIVPVVVIVVVVAPVIVAALVNGNDTVSAIDAVDAL